MPRKLRETTGLETLGTDVPKWLRLFPQKLFNKLKGDQRFVEVVNVLKKSRKEISEILKGFSQSKHLDGVSTRVVRNALSSDLQSVPKKSEASQVFEIVRTALIDLLTNEIDEPRKRLVAAFLREPIRQAIKDCANQAI